MKYYRASIVETDEGGLPISNGYSAQSGPFVSDSDGDTLKGRLDTVVRNEVNIVNRRLGYDKSTSR